MPDRVGIGEAARVEAEEGVVPTVRVSAPYDDQSGAVIESEVLDRTADERISKFLFTCPMHVVSVGRPPDGTTSEPTSPFAQRDWSR